jgi:hypothetical protein
MAIAAARFVHRSKKEARIEAAKATEGASWNALLVKKDGGSN